ncbi:MAG: hypothetical protein ACTJHE_11480 [Vibrio casei]
MTNDIEKIDRLISELKEIKKLKNKNMKLSNIDTIDMTPKRRDKINVDMGWNAMDRIKHEHESHALCVELGLAERREDYSEIELYPDNWHKYNYKPREPHS